MPLADSRGVAEMMVVVYIRNVRHNVAALFDSLRVRDVAPQGVDLFPHHDRNLELHDVSHV